MRFIRASEQLAELRRLLVDVEQKILSGDYCKEGVELVSFEKRWGLLKKSKFR